LGIKQSFHILRSWVHSLIGKNSPASLQLLFCVFWFLVSFIPISLGGRFFFHYYNQLIPPLCLLAAISSPFLWKQKKYQVAIVFLCILPLIVFMSESTSRNWQGKKNFEIVGEYIRENSQPHDRVFIWGVWPRMYYFTKRRLGSRFIFCDYLTGSTSVTHGMDFDPQKPQNIPSALTRVFMDLDPKDPPVRDYDTSLNIVPGTWSHLFEDLEKNRPLYFVDTSTANIARYGKYPLIKFPKLKAYIDKNYQWEKKVEGVDLYRRKSL